MITSVDEFLRYFDGVNRRAVRDVSALPTQAETWKPAAGDGENAWGVGELVAHMAASRGFFASAFAGDGWQAAPWPGETFTKEQWVNALGESADQVRRKLEGAAPDSLTRKVASLDTPDLAVSGWRLLMMMVEHDVHHRSQIQTYAGINAWPVQQIFGRTAEEVGLAARPSPGGRD
jgi:uncharacterized damage-inducible protein DinB